MPADTNSPLLGLLLQGTGNNDNSWGENLNNFVFTYLENAVAGFVQIAVDGGTDQLTAAQNRSAKIEFTGTLGSNQVIEVDNVSHSWIMRNGTSGNFTLTIKTASGVGRTLPQGGFCRVWCDGDDHIFVGLATDAAGTTVYGNVNFAGALTVGGQRPNPIGISDTFEGIFAPSGWLFMYGQAVSRETYSELFEALTATATATKNGSTTLSGVSVDFRNLGLIGAYIEGTGINTGTTISAITATTITLSAAASGSGSIDIRILPHGQGDGSSTYNIPDGRSYTDIGRGDMGGSDPGRVVASSDFANPTGLGKTGGSYVHVLTTPQTPAHNHTATDGGHTHSASTSVSAQYLHTVLFATGVFAAGSGTAITQLADQTVSIFNVSAGTSIGSGTASISVGNTGGNGAHNNMQPSRTTNKIIFTGVFS